MESILTEPSGIERNGEEGKDSAMEDSITDTKESSKAKGESDVGAFDKEEKVESESKEAKSSIKETEYVGDDDVKMEAAEVIEKNSDIETCKGEGKSSTSRAAGEDSATSLSRAIPRKRRRIERESLHDEESENGDEDAPMDVSLSQLKRQVLGRDLKVDDHGWEDEDDIELRQVRALMNASDAGDGDDQPEATPAKDADEEKKDSLLAKKNAPSLSEKLRKDLMCAICHEVVYPPVALSCGHSFCQPCIDWWLDHDEAGRCPTCRRSSPNHQTSPNLALRACVMAMFGPEIIQRIQNRKKMRPKGENGGAHDAGYQILSELRDETWHYVGVETESNGGATKPATTVQVRRSIVLDAEDQRMQLALAVYYKPVKEAAQNNDHCGRFRIELCLLTMEEDEAVDSGFPTSVTSPEDEYFVCGNNRFPYTHLDVQMKDENGSLSPLARVSADTSDGRFKYLLDPSESAGNAGTESIRALLFEHSETGLQLEIDLSRLQNRVGGSSVLPPNHARQKIGMAQQGLYYSDEEYYDNSDGEEDGENQNEFEEDGFLVGDDEASHAEGTFSDESIDEEDRCVICKDGGELMVCDGGDEHPGCGKSFHAVCVNRSAIPDGDWVCQACAKSADIDTGIVGHEFPGTGEVSQTRSDGDDSRREESGVAGRHSDSEVEGAFSDDDNSGNQKLPKGSDDDDSESKEKPDCEDTPSVKPSGNGNKGGIKRRFVLDDSDSD